MTVIHYDNMVRGLLLYGHFQIEIWAYGTIPFEVIFSVCSDIGRQEAVGLFELKTNKLPEHTAYPSLL